jgi:hypothetical protein
MPKGFLRTALALLAATVGGAAFADDAKLAKRSYPVGEFVVSAQQPGVVPPPPVAVVPATQLATPPVPPPQQMWHMQSEVRRNAEALARVVVKMVKPHSWAGMGGAGSIVFDEASSALVVTQTADVHAYVADLIASMRRVHAASMPQVMLEFTVVEVPETVFESAGVDAEVQAVGGTSVPTPACPDCERCPVLEAVRTDGKKPPAVTLSADQVKCLMKCVQANRHVNVLTRPRLIVEDMQTGYFQVGEQARFLTGLELIAGPNGVERRPQYRTVQLGTTISATPTVSADRQSVKLRLLYKTAQPTAQASATVVKVGEEANAEVLTAANVDIQAIESTLAIPAGKTVLLACRMATRPEQTVVLTKVPSTNRVTVNREVHRVTNHHLLLVTAKVLSQPGDCCPPMACKLPSPVADCKACPTACEAVAAAKPARPADTEAARLVAAYHKACADGRAEEALRLAMQALARDPSCFADQK